MTAAIPSRLNRWLQPLVAPAVFDFWAGQFGSTLRWQRVLARVVERRVEARDTVTLLLQPNRHFRGFRPGQHLHVTVEVDGVQLTRSYSLSDVPRADGLLAITVRRVVGGKVSEWLTQRVAVGDVLELGQAFGEMTLAPDVSGPVLLLAAGSGITPLMSQIRFHLATGNTAAGLTLCYWAKNRADLCFLDELKALAVRHPHFRLQVILTRETNLLAGEASGRPSAELLATLLRVKDRPRVLACGPHGFVDTVRGLLAPTAASFQAEAFTPPMLDAGAPVTGAVQLTLARSQQVVEVPAGQPLLAALEAQGIFPPSGCRMGICHTCACGKKTGVTENLQTGELDTEADATVRLCVSRARTDLVLDL